MIRDADRQRLTPKQAAAQIVENYVGMALEAEWPNWVLDTDALTDREREAIAEQVEAFYGRVVRLMEKSLPDRFRT